MVKLLIFIFSIISLNAQLPPTLSHSVVINWQDTQNPPNTKYNVYRLVGSCPGLAPTPPGVLNGFILLNPGAPITGTTNSATNSSLPLGINWIDQNVQSGQTYCYFVVAFSNTGYGPPSLMVSAIIPGLLAVSGVSAVVQ